MHRWRHVHSPIAESGCQNCPAPRDNSGSRCSGSDRCGARLAVQPARRDWRCSVADLRGTRRCDVRSQISACTAYAAAADAQHAMEFHKILHLSRRTKVAIGYKLTIAIIAQQADHKQGTHRRVFPAPLATGQYWACCGYIILSRPYNARGQGVLPSAYPHVRQASEKRSLTLNLPRVGSGPCGIAQCQWEQGAGSRLRRSKGWH
jgi:hypothetical protein